MNNERIRRIRRKSFCWIIHCSGFDYQELGLLGIAEDHACEVLKKIRESYCYDEIVMLRIYVIYVFMLMTVLYLWVSFFVNFALRRRPSLKKTKQNRVYMFYMLVLSSRLKRKKWKKKTKIRRRKIWESITPGKKWNWKKSKITVNRNRNSIDIRFTENFDQKEEAIKRKIVVHIIENAHSYFLHDETPFLRTDWILVRPSFSLSK